MGDNHFVPDSINSTFSFDYKALSIFVCIVIISLLYKRIKKSNISPIFLIFISAFLGIILYGVI